MGNNKLFYHKFAKQEIGPRMFLFLKNRFSSPTPNNYTVQVGDSPPAPRICIVNLADPQSQTTVFARIFLLLLQ